MKYFVISSQAYQFEYLVKKLVNFVNLVEKIFRPTWGSNPRP